MLSIFKKSLPRRVDFSPLVTDMHSHLLPGIDDGAPDVQTSDVLIKGLIELGFSKLITTPHIMADIYPNNYSVIEKTYQHLRSNTELPTVGFPVTPAAEYLLDDGFDELIKEQQSLLPIKDNLVLVEFSFAAPPNDYKEKIFQMQLSGYHPVLAHPERYLYWYGNKRIMDEFKTIGCLLAVNILSFTGYYGKASLDLANILLKKNYVDFLGTDLHHMRHLEALQQSQQVMPVINQLLDKGNLLNPRL
jgi:tyrosine-protein phosphatase YwqE